MGHNIRSVSTSGLSAKSTDNSWSGPEADSNRVSNTAGDISDWRGLAVKDSYISTGSWVMLGISVWSSEASDTGTGSCIGDEVFTATCIGGEMSTLSNV